MNTESMIEKLEGAARWYIRRKVGEADDVRAQIASVDSEEPDEILATLTERSARRAAARAFMTGLFGSPWTAIPLSLIDMEGATSAQATLAASRGVIDDPGFFERPDWDRDVLGAVLEVEPSANSASLFGAALLKRVALGRLKKSGVRIASNALPAVLGGLAGAGIEYATVKRFASRMKLRAADASVEIPTPVAVEPGEPTPRVAPTRELAI